MKLHIITGNLATVELYVPIAEIFPDEGDVDRKIFEEGRATGMRDTIEQRERIIVRADAPDGLRLEALVKVVYPLLVRPADDGERRAAIGELRAFVDGLGRRDS